MAKIEIRQASSGRSSAPPSPAVLLCLICGLTGISLILREIPGCAFGFGWFLLPATALCTLLWFLRRLGGKRFWLCYAAVLLACTGVGFAFRETLHAQFTAAMGQTDALASESDFSLQCAGAVLGLVLSLTLFSLECLAGSHLPGWLATTLALLAMPFLGGEPPLAAVALVLFYQLAMPAYHLASRWGIPGLAGKSLAAMGVVAVLCCAAALPVVLTAAETIYSWTYKAEAAAYRLVNTGIAGDPVSGGHITRGNAYMTDTPQLLITASREPQQPIYLKGFSGGEYLGGDWAEADDDSIYADIAGTSLWSGWASIMLSTDLVNAVRFTYGRLHYNLNTLASPDARPLRLDLRHFSGNYSTAYVPYINVRVSAYAYSKGYSYDFFEEQDLEPSRYSVPAERLDDYDWLKAAEFEYLDRLDASYTSVPTEQLPRFVQLVQDNPLTDLDEITAFILHTLHSNASYTLTPGWSSMRSDPAEDFLFDRHRGFCEHFALAATLLYRLYGVPARYCTGYMVTPDAFDLETVSGRLEESALVWRAVATDADAHAWPEIFLPGYGWTPVEVTPGSGADTSYPGAANSLFQLIQEQKGWNSALTQSETPRKESGGRTAAEEKGQTGAETSSKGIPFPEKGNLVLAAAVLCLILFPPVLLLRRRSLLERTRKGGCRTMFARLIEMLHFAGLLSGMEGSEEEFPLRLSEILPGLEQEEAGHFVSTVNRAAFGPAPPDLEEERLAWRFYCRSAETVLQGLKGRKRLLFKWILAFG